MQSSQFHLYLQQVGMIRDLLELLKKRTRDPSSWVLFGREQVVDFLEAEISGLADPVDVMEGVPAVDVPASSSSSPALEVAAPFPPVSGGGGRSAAGEGPGGKGQRGEKFENPTHTPTPYVRDVP